MLYKYVCNQCEGLSMGYGIRPAPGTCCPEMKIVNGICQGCGTKRKSIAIDLDGVIFEYDGWRGEDHFGEPIESRFWGEFLKIYEEAPEELPTFELTNIVIAWMADVLRVIPVKMHPAEALAELQRRGWTVIIWTTRKDLDKVRKALEKHRIPFDYINENPHAPHDESRKIYADVYIDDRAEKFWR